MEYGMKRVLASVQAAATLNKLYDGSPVSLTAISKESKLSTSYLEQIFKSCGRVTWLFHSVAQAVVIAPAAMTSPLQK
ncbi:transcriptional regulator [Klebsiella quasipneumoniae]|nr:transcriptional regulator [Klebsiella quasipneumoniae]